MEEYKKITILLKKGIFTEIEKHVSNRNMISDLNNEDKPYYTVEDFIVGVIYDFFDQLYSVNKFAGLDDLGKPYRLKNRLKEYLAENNMRQTDLAKLTGINQSNISLIVNNSSQPSLDYFLRIWIGLECPPLDQILYREK